MPQHHTTSRQVEVADPGALMHSHQSNKVVALLELEEIIEGFSGLSDVIPNDLKRALVTWRVDALYRVSSANPHELDQGRYGRLYDDK